MIVPLCRGIMLCLPIAWLIRKIAADVEVHHLVPGLERMILGRRAPGGAGVVDQDVDLAEVARIASCGTRTISLGWLQSAAIQSASMPRAFRCARPIPRGRRPCARSA